MNENKIASCLGLILVFVIVCVFGGALSFGLGCLGGLFLQWICGDAVANGLNMVLGNITQYEFTPSDIPLFSGIMTTIGGFFKIKNIKTDND